MLQNIKKTRGGFTLVEIMIVVAIIALLATLAAPNIMRARLRAQASATKAQLSQIDAAIDQWAIEHNAKPGDAVTVGSSASDAGLAVYIKSNSTLATQLASGSATDPVGNPIPLTGIKVGGTLSVSASTAGVLAPVTTALDANYWAPFTSVSGT